MRRSALALVLASTLALAPPPAGVAVDIQNPSFEAANGDGTPAGWGLLGGPYTVRVDGDAAWDGARSVRVERTAAEDGFGGLVQRVDPTPFQGHGLVLRGRIRTAGVTGRAALWARADAGRQMLALENMPDGPAGTTGWAPFEVRLPVAPNATQIMVGVLQSGDGASWYDALELAVDSAVTAEEVAVEELPPPDTTLVAADPAAVAAVRSTAWPIRSLTDGDRTDDLAFLREAVGDRRVVQLGESGHGVKEFNQVKVRLIKHLHEELGFDVIAFESSLFECWNGWRHADSLSAEGLMDHCIFGVWHADETLELFEYVQETRRTDRPLILAGWDTQTSSSATPERLDFWTEVIGPVDPARATAARALDSTFLAHRRDSEALAGRADSLLAAYRALAAWLEEEGDALRSHHADAPEKVGVARRLAASTDFHIRQLTLSGGAERTETRDQGMAENLLFLMDELYPDAKIITWGHNFHLRHANEQVGSNPVKTTGQWLAEARRDDLYTVGLYMRRGRAAWNNREAYNVEPPPEGSLESILAHALRDTDAPALFVDLERTAAAEGGGWIRTEVPTLSWGRSEVALVPIDQYDAVILVDEVTPPDYR